MLFKTSVQKTNAEIQSEVLGDKLLKLIEDYRTRKISEVPMMFFEVDTKATHTTFYTLSFGVPDDSYRDIFIGCHVLDYTQTTNHLIEIEDTHEQDFGKEFTEELYAKLSTKPMYLLEDLVNEGFKHYYSNGFWAGGTTTFQETVTVDI